jgi:pilus assembly protein CpaF
MSGIAMPQRAARAQIASALHVVIQVSRLSDGRRKVTSLSELTGMEGETITMQEIFRFKMEGVDENQQVIGHFEATGIRPKFLQDAEAHGIKLPAELFRPEMRIE